MYHKFPRIFNKLYSAQTERKHSYFIDTYFIFNNPRSHETTHDAKTAWVNFDEGGNQSTQRKPSKSGWDQIKNSAHIDICSRGGRHDNDDPYASLTHNQ